MAYLDDNNENLYTPGSDPLEELDKELAELRATLDELDGKTPSSPEPSESPAPEAPQPAPKAPQPAPKVETPAPRTVEEPARRAVKHQQSGRKNRTPLIVVIAVLCVALIAGLGYGVMRLLIPQSPADPNAAPTAGGEVVTINDSVMGDIELKTVKGAEISTYSAENLNIDENGYYAYYDADGKKLSHLGVDLSEYQGDVDFAKAKAAGVEFVMLRLGGRYYGDEGKLYEDGAFDSYYEQAKAAGLKVGAYFFSQATSAEDAVEEANFAIAKLAGKKLDYPLAFDWENIEGEDARTDSVTGEELTLIAEAFCDAVTDAGYKAIVYSNAQQMFVMYDFETMKDYDFWLADYRDFPSMYYNYDMWQYSMEGSVDGIDGSVDLNISFTDFA